MGRRSALADHYNTYITEKYGTIFPDDERFYSYLLLSKKRLEKKEKNYTLEELCEAVFYIGKGTADRSMHHFKKAADDYIESLTLNGRKTHCIVNDWKAGTKVGFVRLQCDSLEPVTLYIEGCLIHFFSLLELTNKKEGDWTQLFRTISGLDNETVNEMSTKEKAKLKSKERHDQDKPTAAEMVDVAVFILCEVLEDLDKRVVWMPLPKNKKK